MPRRSMWTIFAVVVISLACYERADHNPYGRWFSEVLETIDRQYLEPVDDQKLFEGALSGMVRKLDDYSAFLPRSETPQFQESIDQQYGGVGIEVSMEGPDKQLTVMNLLAGTPASSSGLRAGDRIVSVDGQSTERVDLHDLIRLLRGKPGAPVQLTVRRNGQDEPLDFKLVRALIKVDSVRGYTRNADGTWDFQLPDQPRLGYVRIESFGESTVAEFEAAMTNVTEHHCAGVILDMRNNPGGLLKVAEDICNLFIPRGALIVSTRGRDGREARDCRATGSGPYQTLPLVVLVNDKSASAAEIVAACLQDHKRASVVGERTWGKGTVQNVIPLEGGKSLLKLTIASYWRPSGKNIHRAGEDAKDWGVSPDPGCEVKLNEKQALAWLKSQRRRDHQWAIDASQTSGADEPTASADSSPFDPQLQRAIDVLNSKLASATKSPAA